MVNADDFIRRFRDFTLGEIPGDRELGDLHRGSQAAKADGEELSVALKDMHFAMVDQESNPLVFSFGREIDPGF